MFQSDVVAYYQRRLSRISNFDSKHPPASALIYTEKTRKDPRRPEKTRKDALIYTEKTRKDALIYTEKTREDPKRPEKTRKDPKRHPKGPKKTRKDILIVDVSEWKMTRVMLIVFEH